MARAILSRNTEIGSALITYLKTQLALECVAAVLLVSIERTIWFDPDSIVWAVENIIPADIMQEMQRITSFTTYKHLIGKGYVPGKNLSVDAKGQVLAKHQSKKAA